MRLSPGDFVKIRVDLGLGKLKRWDVLVGTVVSFTPSSQNPFEKIGDIEILINGGELRRFALFKSDEVEVVQRSEG